MMDVLIDAGLLQAIDGLLGELEVQAALLTGLAAAKLPRKQDKLSEFLAEVGRARSQIREILTVAR